MKTRAFSFASDLTAGPAQAGRKQTGEGKGVAGKLALPCLLLVVAFGVLACQKKPEADPFTEKWHQKAEQSQGYSPTSKPRKIEYQQAKITTIESSSKAKTERALPTQKVTLKMYNADLSAVIRALARSANQNIMLSTTIQPVNVNVNLSDTPWNEAFLSILRSNGLTHAWDGSILRVMTLDDLKNENALKAAEEASIIQRERIKAAEPWVTCKIPINYADINNVIETVSRYLDIDADPKDSKVQQSSGLTATTSGGSSTSSNIQVSNAQTKPGLIAGGGIGAGGGASGGGGGGGGAAGAGGGGGGAIGAINKDIPGKVRGYIVADRHSNSVILQATKENSEMLIKLIEQLDQPRPQVKIKAYIVETSKDTARELGMQWGGALKTGYLGNNDRIKITPAGSSSGSYYGSGKGENGWSSNFPITTTAADVLGGGPIGSGVNFLWGVIGGNQLEMQLTALEAKSKLNILSSPSITTLENQTAYTQNGKTIPFTSTSQNGTNVQWIDAVLLLAITPHVIEDRYLRMDILIKKDEVDSDTSNWVDGNPPIYKKTTQTTLVVENGETIVISGLSKNSDTSSENGFPGLKDIPVVGWAFKNQRRAKTMEEVLVFLTPEILPQREIGEAQAVTTVREPAANGSAPQAPASGRTPVPYGK